jgi:cytoskeleton protein RodZ
MSPLESAIGATLRDTRTRRKIDLAQVESETKIRIRYLRALENEEWDVLPGGAYTRSFIRTYATFLGLDGERLADTYRREFEQTPAERPPRHEPVPAPRPPGAGGTGPGISRGVLAGLISIVLIAILIAIGLLSGGSEDSGQAPAPNKGNADGGKPHQKSPQSGSGVTLRLLAEADVWVCLVNAKGNNLIAGEILAAGTRSGPYRSGTFTVSFGNGSVRMQVNGRQARLEDTPNPVGYRIAAGGGIQPLAESVRPTCQ